jgi:hypothetical protein
MKTLFSALTLALLLSFGAAHADVKTDCEAKAIGKNGKPLAGAAKDNKVKKCLADAGVAVAAPTSAATAGCEAKAIGKNGRKLAGAAKNAFIKKCEKDAAAPTAEAKPAADVKQVAAKK